MVAMPWPPPERTQQLPAQTLARLSARPHVRRVVRSVWDTLADLERDGHHPGALAALRAVLIAHQPSTRAGRCRACRRFSWRRLWCRQTFPCLVWMTTYVELQGRPDGTRRG
jgi:hypothetical protein